MTGDNIICLGADWCSNSELISVSPKSTIQCIADDSCFGASLILQTGSNDDDESYPSVICDGDRSCGSIANGLQTTGYVACNGMASCSDTDISAYSVTCSGDESCFATSKFMDDMTTITTDTLTCSGTICWVLKLCHLPTD